MAGNIVEYLLNTWQGMGMDYILAFLLVFALIFGILSKIDLFKGNRAVNIIISLVMGLISLKFGFLIAILSEIGWRFAIAILVVLLFAIAMLAFAPDDGGKSQKGIMTGLYVAGGVFVLVAVIGAFNTSSINWFNSTWWQDNGGMLIGALLVVGVIVAISLTGGNGKTKKQEGG